jgi:hypothetical protein
MPNHNGQAGTLTVLTPILLGREEDLKACLDQLSSREPSPFQRLGKTHFARWVVIDQLVHETRSEKRDSLKSHYLLFTAIHDGAPDHYLESLCTEMAPEVNEIWGHCVGYPGSADHTAFKVYFERNQLDAGLFFAAYADAPLPEVRESLAFREKLIRFAVETQDLEAGPLYEAYRKTFGQRAEDKEPHAPCPLRSE